MGRLQMETTLAMPGDGQSSATESVPQQWAGSTTFYMTPYLTAARTGGLRGVRTICVSPFPEDQGRVLYLGGFDATRGPHRDTAWIYKGTLK